MTLLLVSVKDAEEARLAVESGADFIDLKDPEVGALGALDEQTSLAILKEIESFEHIQVSATVGDEHASPDELLALVEQKARLGVDFIKLPYSNHLFSDVFASEAQRIKALFHIELIAVMNASETIDWGALSTLKQMGFYGCMLDTFDKKNDLLKSIKVDQIIRFVNECKESKLFVGLAGSLRPSMVDSLIKYQSDYLGFRSGVCIENTRKNRLLPEAIKAIKGMLYNHNGIQAL